MFRSHAVVRRLAVLAPVLGASLSTHAASYNFSKIADGSGPLLAFSNAIPGSGLPSINAGGVVAFFATHDAGGSGIYRGVTAGDLVPPGTEWVSVAVTGGTYSDFNRGLPVINNLNQVAFRANDIRQPLPQSC